MKFKLKPTFMKKPKSASKMKFLRNKEALKYKRKTDKLKTSFRQRRQNKRNRTAEMIGQTHKAQVAVQKAKQTFAKKIAQDPKLVTDSFVKLSTVGTIAGVAPTVADKLNEDEHKQTSPLVVFN